MKVNGSSFLEITPSTNYISEKNSLDRTVGLVLDSSVETNKSKKSSKTKMKMDPKSKFEAKYQQENELGEGGCGLVFVGYCKTDNLPVLYM